MKRLLVILLVASATLSNAQMLDTLALDTAIWYKSIEAGLENPDEVYKLDLSKEKLTEFPVEILQFKNLNVLDLSKNKFETIPDTIQELKYLQELNLSKNKLIEFPYGVCMLRNLKYLNINQNRIVVIPQEIKYLSELRVLDMWSNDLTDFPIELSHLKKLENFDLRNILINEGNQKRIKSLLPNANVFMDKPCNCGQ